MRCIRILSIIVLLMSVPSPTSAQKPGKKLFDDMNQVLLKCKTYETDIEVALSTQLKMKGRWVIQEDGKTNLSMQGTIVNTPFQAKVTSNGEKMYSTIDFANNESERASNTPKQLSKKMLGAFGRAGVYVAALGVGNDGDVDLDKDFTMSGFTLGQIEKIQGKEAQIVHYQLKIKKTRMTFDVQVWIDLKTKLPLKRVSKSREGHLIELYKQSRIDKPIDAKLFTPKN